MKYFLHDTNSFSDEKISELFIRFGYEGLGLFYSILEKLALQEKPIKTSILKRQLYVGKKLEKIWSFLEEIDLISSSNDETFNERLLNFSEKYQIRKEKNREKIEKHRKKISDIQYYNGNVTSYETDMKPNCNGLKVNKENKRKEKKGVIVSFDPSGRFAVCADGSKIELDHFDKIRLSQSDLTIEEAQKKY